MHLLPEHDERNLIRLQNYRAKQTAEQQQRANLAEQVNIY